MVSTNGEKASFIEHTSQQSFEIGAASFKTQNEVPRETNDPFYSKMYRALVTVVMWRYNPPRESYERFPPPKEKSQFVHTTHSTMTYLYAIIPQIVNAQMGPLAGPAGWSQSLRT